MARVQITSGSLRIEAQLDDSPAASRIAQALPIQAVARTWGDEVYFDSGIALKADRTARQVLEVGEIAYWPPGKAICLFFGPTPASESDGKPQAASPVMPVGRILGQAEALRAIKDGDPIAINML